MDEIKRRILSIIIVIVIALAIILAFVLQIDNSKPISTTIELQQGTAFPKGLSIQAFNLIDNNNKTFTKKNLEGHWSLVFFGFTHCLNICQTTLSELNKAYKILRDKNANSLPQVIFVSVDPKRDSPKEIKKYLSHINKSFVGLTGRRIELKHFSKTLGIEFTKVDPKAKIDYQVNHSTAILVINPKGRWVAVLTPPFDANVIANDIVKVQHVKIT